MGKTFVLEKQCLLEWNVYSMQKMLKVGNKHAKVICDICLKLSTGTQKQHGTVSL